MQKRYFFSLAKLPDLLHELQAKRVFLVTDEPAFTLSGARSAMENALASRAHLAFSAFTPNPKLEEIDAGVAAFRNRSWDAIIAIGGGSAMDVAKCIRACALDSPIAVVTKKSLVSESGPPLIAIPTTAGTGSEATHFAAVYVDGRKHSMAHPSMRPAHVFLDNRLTESLPARVALATGLDALCQAIESAWSVRSTPQSRLNAFRALKLAWKYLPICVQFPTPESRRAMLLAAHLAGRAIDISQTTACHALSYSLTAHAGVPHGFAVALMMSPVWSFNAAATEATVSDPRGLPHVRQVMQQTARILGASRIEDVPGLIRSTWRQLGAPVTFKDAGINSAQAIAWITAEMDSTRGGNNPRTIVPSRIADILAELTS